MKTFLRFLQSLSLTLWVGAIVYLSFVVAPAVFTTLTNMDQAGALVGIILTRLHWLGVICGVVYVIVTLILARSPRGLVRLGSVAVIVMIVLTLISQLGVIHRMDQLRDQMGSYAQTPATSPVRMEFNHLHSVSADLEGLVLLFGLIGVFFTARDAAR